MTKSQALIEHLRLEPLPLEGGLFRSTYRSASKLGDKDLASAIYFMLTGQGYSHLHRLPTDEVYHFYLGDPVELLELLPDGTTRRTILGSDLLAGQEVQYVAKAGNWQGSHLLPGGSFALMGTTMCPGFADSDYEHADGDVLIRQYPQEEVLIRDLTAETRHY